MIREFAGQTTEERRAFHRNILAALQDAGIRDYPKKSAKAKYESYFNQLYEYLSTLSAQEPHDLHDHNQYEEEERNMELLPNCIDDEKTAKRQSERILELFPSLTLSEEKWIDIDKIFSLELEFSVYKESLKKRLRRQILTKRITVGFRICDQINNRYNGKAYYVYKYSIFALFSSWNILSFQSAMLLESKLTMSSNQNIENLLEDLKECTRSTKRLVEDYPIQNEQQEMQKRMFQLFNQFDEFMFSSAEKKSSFDITTILLDIRKNNNSLAGICQAILKKLNNSQPTATPGPNQIEALAVVMRQGGTQLVNELTSTLENQLQAIERNILKELRFQIIDQFQKDHRTIVNLQCEQNTQLMKLYQTVTNYQASTLIAVQSAHSQIKTDIQNNISAENILLLQAIEKIHEEYNQLCKDCKQFIEEEDSTKMIE